MNEYWARLRKAFDALTPSERNYVTAAGLALLLALLFFGVINPILSASARASARIGSASQQLEVVRRLRLDYDEVNGRLAEVEQRIQSGPRGEIFTTLETLGRESAVKVNSMEPKTAPASEDYRETKVQVTLKAVTLTQLVNYLHRIEASAQVLSIKSLRVRTRKDKPEFLDVSFTVSSFEPVG